MFSHFLYFFSFESKQIKMKRKKYFSLPFASFRLNVFALFRFTFSIVGFASIVCLKLFLFCFALHFLRATTTSSITFCCYNLIIDYLCTNLQPHPLVLLLLLFNLKLYSLCCYDPSPSCVTYVATTSSSFPYVASTSSSIHYIATTTSSSIPYDATTSSYIHYIATTSSIIH